VRAFAGKRSVVAFRIAPIADMNELTTHILEVIYAHAYLVRGGTSMVWLACFVTHLHFVVACFGWYSIVVFTGDFL